MLFYLLNLFFILPPAASVSPLDRDKVTDLDREKNAQRIFPYFVASQYFYFIYFCLRRPAFRRWSATRSRILTSRKMLSAFFRILLLRNIFILFFLPPAASVSPLECDKVTDLDREKNAQRIFP